MKVSLGSEWHQEQEPDELWESMQFNEVLLSYGLQCLNC